MSDAVFFRRTFYNLYNGFVRGFYHEHRANVIPAECLGDWVSTDLNNLIGVFDMIADDRILEIPYADAIEASKDVVDLIYKNADYCQVKAVLTDLDSLCNMDFCLDDLDVWENIKNNAMGIFGKVEAIIEFFLTFESLDDEDTLAMIDKMGESYGAIVAYIVGFDKRFPAVNPKSLL